MTATQSASIVLGLISNLPMFRQATRPHLAELARHARTEQVRRGAAILRRGERLHGLYAVAYGMVKISLRGDGGEEKVLRLVGAGETFGEPMMFLNEPSPIDAVALADTLLVMVPAAPLLALIETDASFTRSLLASLSQRFHGLVADVEASTLKSGLQRVAAYLDSLAEPCEGAGLAVNLPATKTVIAARLGVTKETFSRLLRELAAQGLINVARREIAILNREQLRQIARGEHAHRHAAITPH